MSIESEVFSTCLIREETLAPYGFREDGGRLLYKKALPEDSMEIVIEYDGTFRGRINDLSLGEEYLNFRIEELTGYSAGIRMKFTDLLLDIRDKCCTGQYFKTDQARRICAYIYEKYQGKPEFLWSSLPTCGAFRRKDSKKWHAVMGRVPRSRIDPASRDLKEVEVINVKAGSGLIGDLLERRGYYPAYHMNKKCWVSAILDDTLPDSEIEERTDISYRSV